MTTVEIRFDLDQVKIRKFGIGDFNRWTILQIGDTDRLTGWSFEELRRLGEGVWGFPATEPTCSLSHARE